MQRCILYIFPKMYISVQPQKVALHRNPAHSAESSTEVNIFTKQRCAYRLNFFLVQKYSNEGVSCRNYFIKNMALCAKILARYSYVMLTN